MCSCSCGRYCSAWGWCGSGGLWESTKQDAYSNRCDLDLKIADSPVDLVVELPFVDIKVSNKMYAG